MKIKILLILLLAASISRAGDFRAGLSYATFLSPVDGPYVETYFMIEGKSIKFVPLPNGKFQGAVAITMLFKQDTNIVNFRKYELLSPEIDDTSRIDFNFIDQQRIPLPNGIYKFEILINDQNEAAPPYFHSEPLEVKFTDESVQFSGIELVESAKRTENENILSRSGYDLVPYVFNFYPSTVNKITFYAEAYNTRKAMGEEYKFLLSCYVEEFETGKMVPNMVRVKKEITAEVIPVLQEFDITGLASGNYRLVMQIRNQKNELMATNNLFFQRSNPNIQIDMKDISSLDVSNTFVDDMKSRDTLAEYIRSLGPISSEIELIFAKKHLAIADLQLMQQYFFNFWLSRNNTDPARAWADYYQMVLAVNQEYSTSIRKGYETDRGVVYLKYGQPSAIATSYHEPSAYPYEIWHYYELKDQRNKKFVFYTRDIATNDFELIHSDAVGELANYRWDIEIHKRDSDSGNVDEFRVPDHWGGKTTDYYRDPR